MREGTSRSRDAPRPYRRPSISRSSSRPAWSARCCSSVTSQAPRIARSSRGNRRGADRAGGDPARSSASSAPTMWPNWSAKNRESASTTPWQRAVHPLLRRHVVDEARHPLAQGDVGWALAEQGVGGVADLLDLVAVGRRGERVAGREVAVQRAHTDAGTFGDRLHGHLAGVVGEGVDGDGEEAARGCAPRPPAAGVQLPSQFLAAVAGWKTEVPPSRFGIVRRHRTTRLPSVVRAAVSRLLSTASSVRA